MVSYKLIWKNSVYQDLKRIDKSEIPALIKEAENLSSNPHPSLSKKLRNTRNIFRIRVRDYRIIYQDNQSKKNSS